MSTWSMRRGPIARGGAWLFIVVSLIILAAWIYSTQRTVFVMAQFGDAVRLGGGALSYNWTSGTLRSDLAARFGWPLPLQWQYRNGPREFPMQWWNSFYSSRPSGRRFVSMPLWIPFVLSSGLAVWLWRRGRDRHGPGRCAACGYDLAGLRSGQVCPECGAAALPN